MGDLVAAAAAPAGSINSSTRRIQSLKDSIRELAARISSLAGAITANARKAIAIIEEEEEKEEGKRNAERIKRLDDLQAALKAEVATVSAQLAHAEAELAQLTTRFSGEQEALELIGPKFTSPLDTLPAVDELSDRLLFMPCGKLPLDANIFAELQPKCGGGLVDAARPDMVSFLERSQRGFPPSQVDLGWLVREYDFNFVQGANAAPFHLLLVYLLRAAGSANVEYSRSSVLRRPSVAELGDRLAVTPTAGSGGDGSAGAATGTGAGGASTATSTFKRARTTGGDRRRMTDSHSADVRPSFLLHIGKLLVLRGEEREGGGERVPIDAQLAKLPEWSPLFFGKVPYVISYVLAGHVIVFYALHPGQPIPPNSLRPVPTKCTQITNGLSLNRAADRVTLLQYVVNLVRVLQALGDIASHNMEPLLQLSGSYTPPRQQTWVYSSLAYETTYVRKVLLNEPGDNYYAFDELEALYELVKEGKVVNTIQCKADYPTYGDDGLGAPLLTLHLFPLGRRAVPATAESLRRCLLTVLGALDSMHEHGFCHRDVRWPNILQKADEDEWMLIDLEFARKMSSSEAPWPFWVREDRDNDGWPQRRGEDGGWRRADDVWMVGGLLVGVEVELDLQSIEQEIKQCTTCAEAKAVVLRRIVVEEHVSSSGEEEDAEEDASSSSAEDVEDASSSSAEKEEEKKDGDELPYSEEEERDDCHSKVR